jgi:hypothetical protein
MLQRTYYRNRHRHRLAFLAIVTMQAAFACSSPPPPLSIKMHNPKTDQTLTCTAKDQLGRTDPSLLAAAVESCAQGLESRGFIRQK